jgi:hypothetical protein
LLMPIASSVFLALSCTAFKVFIHFELKLEHGGKYGSNLVLYRQILSFPSNICWRGCRFSITCFWHLCQK